MDSYYRGDPLVIGNDWQLLMDENMVEDRFRLNRRLIRPSRHPRNPVLIRDRPWEGDGIGGAAIIWDPEAGCYRMWYQCYNMAAYYGTPAPGRAPYYIAYAESDNAVEWEKPLIGKVRIPGFKQTNVVYEGSFYPRVQGPQVWRDENEPNPRRRYKMICVECRPDAAGQFQSGVQMAYSEDGLQWGLDPSEKPLLGYHSDTFNHIVRRSDGLWLLYCRPISLHAGAPAKGRRPDLSPEMTGPRRHAARRVAAATSTDLKTWSYPRTVLYPDERDAPDIDNCCVFPVGSSMVMLYAAMEGDDTGRFELKLATGTDGFKWHRFHTRETFIGRAPAGAWDCGIVSNGAAAPIRQNDRMLYYYSGRNWGQHDRCQDSQDIGGLGLAEGRVNRFVEQVADDRPGYLLTREFILEGDRLEVNTTGASGPWGEAELRVEVLQHLPVDAAPEAENRGDTVIPGFSLMDCDPILGDLPAAPVTWKGSSDLSSLRGQPVYLRFYLRYKGLCAFRITTGEEAGN